MYFLITSSEGEIRIHPVVQYDLLQRLKPNEYGDSDLDGSKAIGKLEIADPTYWPDGAFLIIKGEIVKPQQIHVVTDWTLP